MNILAVNWGNLFPLGQREVWEHLGDRFSGKNAQIQTSELWALAAIGVGAALLIWLLVGLQRLRDRRLKSNHPQHLFQDLCAAHRLRYGDRHRLHLLAFAHQLESPAVVFVRPDLFQKSLLPKELQSEAAEYGRLAKKLFAGLEEPTVGPVLREADATPPQAEATVVETVAETVVVATPEPLVVLPLPTSLSTSLPSPAPTSPLEGQ